MDPHLDEPRPSDESPAIRRASASLRGDIRRQAAWSAIGAALLLYFGFGSDYSDSTAAQVLKYTLQGGGILLAIAAVFQLTGVPFSLAFYGVVSMLTGAGLALCGVLALAEFRSININIVFYLLFGYVFITGGWRDLRIYRQITTAAHSP